MNVASFELSKKLSELSGWKGDPVYYWAFNDDDAVINGAPEYTVTDGSDVEGEDSSKVCPTYGLSFLLRKLPQHFDAGNPLGSYQFFLLPFRDWAAGYAKPEYGKFYEGNKRYLWGNAIATTPEDATCSLAIKLFQKGILKRENT